MIASLALDYVSGRHIFDTVITGQMRCTIIFRDPSSTDSSGAVPPWTRRATGGLI